MNLALFLTDFMPPLDADPLYRRFVPFVRAMQRAFPKGRVFAHAGGMLILHLPRHSISYWSLPHDPIFSELLPVPVPYSVPLKFVMNYNLVETPEYLGVVSDETEIEFSQT